MTAVDTGTALLILVAFVLPGFVAVLLKERVYEVRGEESGYDRMLTIAYYSVLAWAVPALVAVAAGIERDQLERFFNGDSPPSPATAAAAIVAHPPRPTASRLLGTGPSTPARTCC